MEDRFTIHPLRRPRICGKTARVTRTSPNTFVSKTFAISTSVASSTAPINPCPALFTSTSIRPNRPTAESTMAIICAESRRSMGTARSRSGASSKSAATFSGFREVATTQSPRASAARTNSRPNPREAPVITQTRLSGICASIKNPSQQQTKPNNKPNNQT